MITGDTSQRRAPELVSREGGRIGEGVHEGRKFSPSGPSRRQTESFFSLPRKKSSASGVEQGEPRLDKKMWGLERGGLKDPEKPKTLLRQMGSEIPARPPSEGRLRYLQGGGLVFLGSDEGGKTPRLRRLRRDFDQIRENVANFHNRHECFILACE